MLNSHKLPHPQSAPASVPQPGPRLLSLLSGIESRIGDAHSSASSIIDAVDRIQPPTAVPPSAGPASEVRACGSTVEERLEAALGALNRLVDRLTGAAQRLDSLV